MLVCTYSTSTTRGLTFTISTYTAHPYGKEPYNVEFYIPFFVMGYCGESRICQERYSKSSPSTMWVTPIKKCVLPAVNVWLCIMRGAADTYR